jgi:hypothetical protein
MFLNEIECEDEETNKNSRNPKFTNFLFKNIWKNGEEKIDQILELLQSQRKKMKACFMLVSFFLCEWQCKSDIWCS